MMTLDNKNGVGNPVVKHKYTCDPTAIVYKDQLFLYTGHDQAPVGTQDYNLNEWLCFSSTDLVHWIEHPVPLRAIDFAWAKGDAYASKVIQKGNLFYWYVAVSHGSLPGKAIGVAVSTSPAGQFYDQKKSALITHDMLPPTANEKANLDPSVLIDEDGQAYIFWGNKTCFFARLKESMTELDGPIEIVDLPNFEEGIHIHKQHGWYYASYGYGMPEKVAYAMSRQIKGPWEFKGILNELAGNCETNRPAIIDFKGHSYFIYHNGGLTDGGSHRRSVCIDYLHYNSDGTLKRVIMSTEGVQPAG